MENFWNFQSWSRLKLVKFRISALFRFELISEQPRRETIANNFKNKALLNNLLRRFGIMKSGGFWLETG